MRKLFILLLMTPVLLYSQGIDNQNPFFTVRGNVGIPRTTGSMMFRTCFTGIYEANLSFNIRPGKNFFVGLGYENALFKVQKTFVFIRANNGALSYNTKMEQNGVFLKFGYDQFIGDAVFLNYSLNTGMLFCKYTNVIPDSSDMNKPYGEKQFFSPYAQPELSVNFMAGEDQRMAFSIMISYTTLFSKFDPRGPRLRHINEPTVHIKTNHYFMNWLNVGLGCNIFIGKRKRTAPPVSDEVTE